MLALSQSIFPLSMTLSLATRAYGTSIFAFGSESPWEQFQSPIIGDDTAKLLLELRMKAPAATLGEVGQGTVELLNQVGGSPAPLFTATSSGKVSARRLVIVHGVNQELYSSMREEFETSLVAQQASHDSWLNEFTDSLIGSQREAQVEERHCVSFDDSKAGSNAVEPIASCLSKSSIFSPVSKSFDEGQVEHARIIETKPNQRTPFSLLTLDLKPSASSDPILLRSLFHSLHDLALDGAEVTALLSPEPSQKLNDTLNSQRSAKAKAIRSSWSELEQPTSLTPPVAPVCYASNSSCNDATNTCSGHGFCYKKSSNSDEGTSGDCYSCKCQKTTVRKGDGTVQTVQWGGPACQKRDISSPFFLIAGISILVVVAISAAVGLLFNVGQGELPGVIGAGVGTATQK